MWHHLAWQTFFRGSPLKKRAQQKTQRPLSSWFFSPNCQVDMKKQTKISVSGPMANRKDNQECNKHSTHQKYGSGNIFKTKKIPPHFPTPSIFRYIPTSHREALHSCWMYFGLSVLAFAPNVVAVDLTNTPPVGVGSRGDILRQDSPLPKGIA